MSVFGAAARAPIPLRPGDAAALPWRGAPEWEALERLVGACLELVGDEGLERLVAVGLELAAGAARAKGQARRASRLAGAVAALAGGAGFPHLGTVPTPHPTPPASGYPVPGTRPASSRSAEGPAGAPARAGRDPWGPLSAREREVAGLIAEGLTNRQIAEQLVISERTADTHVQNILSKLGLGCRAQVAAWVASRALR
jgi:non-specific serine/threonine protein kinase